MPTNYGLLFWRCHVSDKVRAGSLAGSLRGDGYVLVKYKQHRMLAHRAAWAITYGQWPAGNIDHINGIRDDNRIANLRVVDQRTNIQNLRSAKSNSRTGILGAFVDKKRFSSRIVVNGKCIRLGTFATAEEAGAAYIEAKRRLHAGCSI